MLQQVAIGGKADACNIAVLLGSQQVPGSPYLKIPHGDFKACTQLRKITDGLQPFGSHLTEGLVPFIHEVRIGKPGRTSNAATHLIQLG